MVAACLLVVLVLRYGFLKPGGKTTQIAGEAGQASPGQTKRATAVESDQSAGMRGGSAAPFPEMTPSFGEEGAVPVAFRGVVLNEAGRSPIAGAHVRILALASPSETLEKVTGEDGGFTIETPAAYRYEINVEADGFNPYRNDSLVITRPTYSMEILLSRALILKGRVVDLQSQGIPGALVGLVEAGRGGGGGRGRGGGGGFSMSTATDAQGVFTLNLMPMQRGGQFQVDATHAGYESMGSAVARMPSDEEIIIRMKPSPGTGSLVGSVKDTGFKPVAGAKISILEVNSRQMVSTVTTDQKGEYRLARLREGIFLVLCTADGYSQQGRTDTSQIMATISAGKESRLDFSLKAGQQIQGIVVNDKGEPVPNATLVYGPASMQGARGRGRDEGSNPMQRGDPRSGGPAGFPMMGSVTTDAKGGFQILGLTESLYQVSVQHRDYLDFSAQLQVSSQPQTLTLDSAFSLSGAARDAQGASIERFTLIFQSASAGDRFGKSYSFTTSDGRFEVRGLARDRYTVVLSLSGGEIYSGTLDFQASTKVLLVTGEKPEQPSDPRGGRSGGRGDRGDRGGRMGRGMASGTLTVIKAS